MNFPVIVVSCRSLNQKDIFESIMSLVHSRYNAYGHVVTNILADSLPAFAPVISMLGAVGIRMILVTPGQHAQRVERSIGSSAGWRRAILASLSYVLPPQYELYLYVWIADVSGGVPNVHSAPTVSDVLVTGQHRPDHYKYPELRFGLTCMVMTLKGQRESKASHLSVSIKDIPRAELGGVLRLFSGKYWFL